MRLTQIVEALLFATDAPLTAEDIARVDERLDEDTVQAVVQQLREEYEAQERAWQIYEIAGGYQLLTRPDYAPYLERYDTVPQQTRLSNPALEVLAVIAYRQPLGRNEIEEIRGVSSSGVLKTLQDRHLIDVVGRSEGLGRPLLYGTTQKFLEHFGFNSLEDLPRPDDLPVVLRERPIMMMPVSDETLEGEAAADASATVETAEEPQVTEAELIDDIVAANPEDAAELETDDIAAIAESEADAEESVQFGSESV
jgi:segregation and condensation protein B